jgi:hypothetical protein
MKTYFVNFITLVSSYLLCIANGQGVSMLRLASQGEEQSPEDLTAAAKLVQGLTFDIFNDKISCEEQREILLADFSTVIEKFARRFSSPADVKDSLLEAQYHKDMTEIVKNFKFENGETGRFVYGKVATIKQGSKIDMAYSVYTLDFKLTPTVRRHKWKHTHRHKNKHKKKHWRRCGCKNKRNLSAEEKVHLDNYLTIVANSKLRSAYHKNHEVVQFPLQIDLHT